MKINTQTQLIDFHGKVLTNQDNKELTLGHVLSNVLSTIKSDDSVKSYRLAKEFALEDEVELKSDDVVFIKKVLKESYYTPIITGQIIDILEK